MNPNPESKSPFSIIISIMVIVACLVTIYIFFSIDRNKGTVAIVVPPQTQLSAMGQDLKANQIFTKGQTEPIWVYQFELPSGKNTITLTEPKSTPQKLELHVQKQRKVQAYHYLNGKLEPY